MASQAGGSIDSDHFLVGLTSSSDVFVSHFCFLRSTFPYISGGILSGTGCGFFFFFFFFFFLEKVQIEVGRGCKTFSWKWV
jgi:hypothetical protein